MDMRGDLTMEMIDASLAAHPVAISQRPSGVSVVVHVHGLSSLPSASVRAHASTAAQRYAHEVRSHVTAIEAEGFLASAARSVVTGIMLLARQPYPQRVCATLDEAARFTCESIAPPAPTPGQLVAAMHLLVSMG